MHFLHHLQKVWILFKFGYLRKSKRLDFLRHSHVSLLINMGFTVLAIADRMGHESIDITYRYAHLFPSEQTQMAEQLDIERMEKLNGEKSGQ